MDINFLRGILTIVLMALFLALVFKVYSPSQKRKYEEAGLLPLNNNVPDSQLTRSEKSK